MGISASVSVASFKAKMSANFKEEMAMQSAVQQNQVNQVIIQEKTQADNQTYNAKSAQISNNGKTSRAIINRTG